MLSEAGPPAATRVICVSRPPACASASSTSTPGITGCPGKWPWKNGSLPVTFFHAEDALAGLELDHAVDQQERVAMRQQRPGCVRCRTAGKIVAVNAGSSSESMRRNRSSSCRKRTALLRQSRFGISGVPEEYSPVRGWSGSPGSSRSRPRVADLEVAETPAPPPISSSGRCARCRRPRRNLGEGGVRAPMRALWPTWIWLSRRTSSSSTVSSIAPRSMLVLAPISQSSPTTTPPSLRHLQPAARRPRQAESVGAEHRARMHQHAPARAHALDQRHRDQFAAFADHAILADHASGADDRAGLDPRTRADANERADLRGRIDHCIGGDDRGWMHAGLRCGTGFEFSGELRECAGIVGEERGAGVALSAGRITTAPARSRARCGGQLRAVARVGEEGELAGFRRSPAWRRHRGSGVAVAHSSANRCAGPPRWLGPDMARAAFLRTIRRR